jgi:hypothetical protein
MMRAFRAAAIIAALALCAGPAGAQSSPNVTSTPFTFTAVNQSVTVPLTGFNSCAVTVISVGTGGQLTPTASSDGTTYIAASAINSGAAITTVGTYIGLIAPYGLTQFRLQATALTSGTASGTVACSTSNAAATVAAGTSYVAAGVTTNTTIKATPGRLFSITCTTTGTNVSAMNVTDGANVVAQIPATCAAGTVVSIPAGGLATATNLVVTGQTGAPALTIGWS